MRTKRDWLPLGFMTVGVIGGFVALAAAVLIRLELLRPSVQYFLDSKGSADVEFFSRLGNSLGLSSTLFCALPMMFSGLGYVFLPASSGRDKTVLRPLGWIGLIALIIGFICLIAANFLGSGPQHHVGWENFLPQIQLVLQGSVSFPLVAIGYGLGLMSFALVSLDFFVSTIVGQADEGKRPGVAAWSFALCGLTFLVVIVARFLIGSDFTGFILLEDDPLNLFLLLVSLTVALSALSMSVRSSENSLILPLIFSIAFFLLAAFGGQKTVTLSQAGSDRVFHDTYFVVAYSHFAFQSVSLFAIFAGISAVFPSIGRQLWLGVVQAVLMLIGVVMTFAPQIYLGFRGMPRRYVDYTESFEALNYISSLGSFLTDSAIGLWIVIILRGVLGPGREA